MDSSKPQLNRSYPLSALFLLIAACSVVLGYIGLLARQGERLFDIGPQILGSIIVGCGVLMLLGMVMGCFQYARVRGILWGVLVGWLLGVCFGPVIFIPAKDFPWVLLTSLAGSVVVVGTGALIRLTAGPVAESSATGEAVRPAAPSKRHPLDPDPDEDEA